MDNSKTIFIDLILSVPPDTEFREDYLDEETRQAFLYAIARHLTGYIIQDGTENLKSVNTRLLLTRHDGVNDPLTLLSTEPDNFHVPGTNSIN